MRVISLDQFEFDNPSTEESVEIAIAARSKFPFPDTESFVSARVGANSAASLAQAISFHDGLAYGMAREYLSRYAKISLPIPCSWPTHVLADGPDDWELIICAPDCFIHYTWSTSA